MNIALRDLNLLVILDSLYHEGSVSGVARRLRMSQPAVSHALERLRKELRDDLFVRSGSGMVPTPAAVRLRRPVTDALKALERVYSDGEPDIADAEARIHIDTTDYIEAVLFPKLLARIAREAPGIKIVSRATTGVLRKRSFEEGELDVAVAGFYEKLPEGFVSQVLFRESYICITRAGHPQFMQGMSLRSFLAARHILASPQGDLDGVVDRALAKVGKKRIVCAGLSGFQSIPRTVASTDFIATIPSRLLSDGALAAGLVVHAPPIEVPGFSVRCIWHERTRSSFLHKWFRTVLKETCASLMTDPQSPEPVVTE